MFSDLHAHYPMDTGSGMKLYDEKSDESHGKLYGDIKWVEVSDAITVILLVFYDGFPATVHPIVL